jgi:DNA-binding response OmpR family regulator
MISPAPDGAVRVGELLINRSRYEVKLAGRDVPLTRREFEILWTLMSDPGKVFSREEMRTVVWSSNIHIEPRTIDVHVAKLRRKLRRSGKNGVYIDTVWGVGYRLRSNSATGKETIKPDAL